MALLSGHAAALPIETTGDYGEGMWCAVTGAIFTLLIVVFYRLFAQLFLGYRPNRRTFGRGFEATPDELRIPKAQQQLRTVPREAVNSLRVIKDPGGLGILLETDEGVLTLPFSVKESLTSAGYFIADPDGIMAREADLHPEELRDVEYVHHAERGRLVSEETREHLEGEARTNRYFGAFIVLVGSVSLILWFFSGAFLSYLGVFCSIVAFLAFVIGGTYLVRSRDPEPTRVYENGILLKNQLGRGVFIPWSQFSECDERTLVDERNYVLRGPGWRGAFIEESMPDYEEVKELVRSRIGDPRYDSNEFHLYSLRRFTLFQVLLAIGTGVAAVISAWLIFLLTGLDPKEPGILFSLALVASWLIFYPVTVLIFVRRKLWYTPTRRFSIVFTTFFLTALSVLLVLLAVQVGTELFETSIEVHRSPDPGQSHLAPGEYLGENLTVDGPVTVHAGEMLTLVNCTLGFDPEPGVDYGIWVEEGAVLWLRNTTVGRAGSEVGYTFEVHGSALIEDCTIHSTSEPPRAIDGDSGLEAYSDDVVVVNTTFDRPLSNGLLAVDCSPRLVNCTFVGAGDDAIEAHRGAPQVTGCGFVGCAFGLTLFNSDARVSNCTFEDCDIGIIAYDGSPEVTDCRFDRGSKLELSYLGDGDPTFSNNTYSEGGGEVEVTEMGGTLLAVGYVLLLLLSVVTVLRLWTISRKLPSPPLEY